MRIRWLGWAGVEIEAQGERVVVDPLQDPTAVFAWLGAGGAIPLPEVVPAQPGSGRRPRHPSAPRSRRCGGAPRRPARRRDGL